MSTTDDAEHSWRIAAGPGEPFAGIGVDYPVIPEPSLRDGTAPALRGHPGGPGFFAPEDAADEVPPIRPDPPIRTDSPGRSVWQQAQAVWRAAGEEWHSPGPDHVPALPALDYKIASPDEGPRLTTSGPLTSELAAPSLAAAPYLPPPAPPASPPTWPYAGPSAEPPSDPLTGDAPAAGTAPYAPAPRVPAPRVPALPDGPSPRRRRPSRLALLAGALAVVLVAAGAASYVAFGRGPGTPPGYPAARLAGGVFGGQAQPGRGVFQSLSRVVSYGNTTVAVGSQTGGDVPRAQFFVSRDGGTTWKLGTVKATDGGPPSPGHAAQLVAAGSAGWLAVGPQAVWSSRNGQSWTLTSPTGIQPSDTGDQVLVLTQTSGGFLAAGGNAAEGTGVIWTSGDGRHWQRMTAAQLSLNAGGGRVQNINYAAAHDGNIVISGQISKTTTTGKGKKRHTVVTHSAATWLSSDDGATWRPVTVPVNHGAGAAFSGIAAGGPGFIAIRPGTTTIRHGRQVHVQPDGVVYVSAKGSGWRYAGTLIASGGLQVGVVKGGAGGFTAAGEGPNGALAAYFSATGSSWRQAAALGAAPANAVTGAAVTAGGTVIAAGTGSGPDQRQPLLTVARPGQAARSVHFAAIPGATISQVAVDAIGVSGSQQIAVGEAGGSPAIWSATGRGSWSALPGLPASSAALPGAQALTSVAHGPEGWLATGGPASGTAPHPLVLTSPDGATWQSADGQAFAGTGLAAAQAAAGPAGYVIVGSDVTGTGTFPAAWYSSDLGTWTRASGLTGGATAAGGAGQMLGAAATSTGFVAVGLAGIHPAVWTSGDGRTWQVTSLPVPGGAASAELLRVVASGQRIVAVGESTSASGKTAAFAEVSTDGGGTWRLARLASPHGQAVATAVTTVPGGFTAVGGYGTPGSLNVAVWTSSNGVTWTVKAPHGIGLDGAGIQEITGLASSGGALTGVGFTATQSGEQPTLWHVPAGEPPAGPAPVG